MPSLPETTRPKTASGRMQGFAVARRGCIVIYRLHRYPTQLIGFIQFADGRRVIVRPALPQDSDLQRAFVRALSDEARYFRFMTRLSELPKAMAKCFTSVDYSSHVALIATTFAGAREAMIGEARYVVDEDDAATCESAVAVADDWQGMGLGRALLVRLADHAASSGIRRMTGDTMATNKAMISLARSIGCTLARKREDARLVHIVKDLSVCDARPDIPRQSPEERIAVA